MLSGRRMPMSWSVSAKGPIAEVKTEIERQFEFPLAQPPAGLTDEGERDTVRLIRDMISQCLGTFATEKIVSVSANGHMGFDSWDKKTGASQTVSVSIQPTQ
jgi:hypothetical protein